MEIENFSIQPTIKLVTETYELWGGFDAPHFKVMLSTARR